MAMEEKLHSTNNLSRTIALNGHDEDHNLVELQSIKEIVEPSYWKDRAKQVWTFVDSDLVRVRHKLLAKNSGLRGNRCAEQHYLFLFGCHDEDMLYVFAHVQLVQALVIFIEHEPS